jgi:predicted RNase H-like HicB family nuclease
MIASHRRTRLAFRKREPTGLASQGSTVELAMANLREAVELFLECASPEEVKSRLHSEVFVTRFEAAYA